jgi:hypothetical protein
MHQKAQCYQQPKFDADISNYDAAACRDDGKTRPDAEIDV